MFIYIQACIQTSQYLFVWFLYYSYVSPRKWTAQSNDEYQSDVPGQLRLRLGLSIVGYVWYLPYMWLRQRGPELHPRFRVASGHVNCVVAVAGSFEGLVWKNEIDEM